MSTYNYSYNVLINRLETFAAGHFLIKRFTHGQIDLADQLQDDQYPFMHVVPEKISPVDGGMQFDFLIMFADIPRDKEYKAEYQREVISDCVRLGQDLIAEVKNGLQLFGFDVQLVNNPTFEPFMEEQKNTVTGVTFTLSLEVPWDWSACDIPAIWAVGGDSTGGTGNPFGLLLQTNDVNNQVQNLLNLSAGTNITITDLGNGTVEFNAIGDGTGTVTSVAITAPSGFNVTGSPITTSGTIAITTNGTTSDYIDGTGAIQPFPSIAGSPYVSTEWNANHTTATGNQYVIGDRVWYNGDVYACIANNDAIIPTNASYWTLQSAGYRLRQTPVDWNASSGDYQILNKPTLATVATTGDYNDLSNLPTIPAAQVNSDWNAISGVAEILNKPTLATVATTGDYNDLINTPAPQGLQDVITTDAELTTNNIILGNSTDLEWQSNERFRILPNNTGYFEVMIGKLPGHRTTIFGDQNGGYFESVGTTVQKIQALFDRIVIQTPAVSSGTATTGQVLTLANATTGEVEYTTVSGGGSGTVTSVALTTPSAFNVSGSPVTTSGTLAITGAGTTSQYVDGTGALQTMPTGLPPTGTAGGDLSGTYPNPTVDGIHGIDMQSGTPSVNDAWIYGGSPAKWQHQHINAGIVDNDSAVTGTTVKDALNHLNTTKVETTRSISTTAPLSGGGDLSANRTLSIADAIADGSTKGAAAFTAADFNSASGVISLDYANGQKASASQPGFLTAADWSTFNSNVFVLRFAVGPTPPADAQTYYFADSAATLSGNATLYLHKFAYPCRLVGASIFAANATANASSETSTLSFRLNNTTDVQLSNAVVFGGTAPVSSTYVITGLSQTIAANDTANIKWVCPTWATNPTNATLIVQLYFEKT